MSQVIPMGRGSTALGVVSKGLPYWDWFAPGAGVCRWVHGDEESPVQGKSRPKFWDSRQHDLAELLENHPIEVALYEGCVPNLRSPIWSSETVTRVIWFLDNRREQSGRQVVPEGWVVEIRILSHSALGSVMNGVFRVRVARREASKELVLSLIHI